MRNYNLKWTLSTRYLNLIHQIDMVNDSAEIYHALLAVANAISQRK